MTHPVFSLPDLEDLELLPAGAQGDLSVDLVVDALGVGQGAAVLPVGPEEAKTGTLNRQHSNKTELIKTVLIKQELIKTMSNKIVLTKTVSI